MSEMSKSPTLNQKKNKYFFANVFHCNIISWNCFSKHDIYKSISEYSCKKHIEGNANIRKFSSNVDEMELVWHRDREDRLIKSTHDTDWKFQFDDELPIDLYKDGLIAIPKGLYHRLIKGTTPLTIKIIEY